uniref:Uncharacterized protein n=1 Tax=Echinococcus canadensis TaxID=519352 RepID=A0A915ETY6_9CEST
MLVCKAIYDFSSRISAKMVKISIDFRSTCITNPYTYFKDSADQFCPTFGFRLPTCTHFKVVAFCQPPRNAERSGSTGVEARFQAVTTSSPQKVLQLHPTTQLLTISGIIAHPYHKTEALKSWVELTFALTQTAPLILIFLKSALY